MALSKEDKGDVRKAMGKALANKVSAVTHDNKERKVRMRHAGTDISVGNKPKVTRDNAWGQSPSESKKEVAHLKKHKLGMFSNADKKLVKENTPPSAKSSALKKKVAICADRSCGNQSHGHSWMKK